MMIRFLVTGLLLSLTTYQALAQRGLVGTYYRGTNFEQKVLTRTDPQLNFDWSNRSPAPGLDRSYYSIRWTGKLLAPVSGTYIFSANVDDGIRVWVGNRKIIDAWGLHDSDRFRGTIVLEAGKYYDLRIDYFNDMLGGVIELLWQRPDEVNKSTSLRPVSAEHFHQKQPALPRPVAVQPKPETVARPVAVAKAPPKPAVVDKPVTVAKVPPKPSVSRPSPKPVVVAAPPVRPTTEPARQPTPEPVASPVEVSDPGVRTVLFEQSTYTLRPASVAELDAVVQLLRQQQTLRVDIAGHTDNVGDPRQNQSLSECRARVVMNYFISHGIAESRLKATGYGGSQPIQANDTEENRARNRRVEFRLIER